ncbi:epoxide hydrolase [Grosmannia clavigera kw1407]|uniref:Epoxide hydrolase n=1 Tax=Grosmannia clavigera (strain kw1407 / UAMH 11150) TaxID=655863 RepID=F0XC41_GROCL|nr:epoxide hydrolase [Grosmannia clavigera kw1407]EFX04228.1 epoxide hydrolase [Grosmannia clavigera kw1407]
MALEKLKPSDPRATHHKVTVNGRTYHYRLVQPPNGRTPTGTIVLIHGFPDLGLAWRNQVPVLAEELGLQVIVPDMLGYGGTDAPDEIEAYRQKSMCSDLVALVDHVGVVGNDSEDDKRFFVGGHDWGGAMTWRMALWHGDRLRGLFSVCTPFFPPATGAFMPLTERVKVLPNFQYQLQFAGDELWRAVEGETKTRQLLDCIYFGANEKKVDGKPRHCFSTERGFDIPRLADMGPTPLLNTEEIEYYTREIARHGLRGPTNWYRTSQLDYEDERVLIKGPHGVDKLTMPALMITAEADAALPPTLTANMDNYIVNLTKGNVPGGHWALWEASEGVNSYIKSFLAPLLSTNKASI